MTIEYENLRKVNEPFFEELKQSFNDVLSSGWYILGDNVRKFEAEFADYLGVKHCSGVASGLDALILSLMVLDIEKGSEIIVPSNTYIATILSIILAGHKPVLAEPDPQTYNIDPAEIRKNISRKTRAVMVVHLYGKSCEMDPIKEICRNNNLYLIEDCAQAHGAKYKGRNVGTFGDLSAFSFYPTKNLGALGDGGCVVTDNTQFHQKIEKLRNYGSGVKYVNEYIGINSRLDEMQAAFLRIKLKALDRITEHKRKLAAEYLSGLSDQFIVPSVNEDLFDVYHIFNICHERRDELKKYLADNEIKTEIHYPVPPHKQKALAFLSDKKFPVCEKIHSTTLSLPVSSFHKISEIQKVIEVLNNFV